MELRMKYEVGCMKGVWGDLEKIRSVEHFLCDFWFTLEEMENINQMSL